MEPFVRPDVLVLGAGGVVGEAWLSGVLAGLEDATGIDFRDLDAFVGTSAGSIVSARLAAGGRPRRPDRPDRGYAEDASGDEAALRGGRHRTISEIKAASGERNGRRWPFAGFARDIARIGWSASAPIVPPAMAAQAPAGARIRASILARVPDDGRTLDHLHAEIRHSGARFDGRLRVCVVDRKNGKRIVFGAPGEPRPAVADAVVASCAVPWVFRPVEIEGRSYVDGGVWSLTNLDAAPAQRDSQVLCLHPIGGFGTANRGSVIGLARTAFGATAEVEALALRRRGAKVRIITPGAEAARAMGDDFMKVRAAGPAHAAGYQQGLAIG